MLKRVFIIIIAFYKKALSPFLPPSCRFYPSCSDYARGALEAHGAAKGALLAAIRLLKCHPFHPGGFDPVPSPGVASPAVIDARLSTAHGRPGAEETIISDKDLY